MKHENSFCRERYGKKYRDLTPEEKKEYNLIRKKLERESHPERLEKNRYYSRKYHQEHKEERKIYAKEYSINNKEKIAEIGKRHRDKIRGCGAGEKSNIFIKYGKRYKDMTLEEKRQVKRDYAKAHRLKQKENK